LVIVTDVSVPSATVTVIGSAGLTPCVPLAGCATSRASGAGAVFVAVLGPGDVADWVCAAGDGPPGAALCWDVHAPSTRAVVVAKAATNQALRTPTDTVNLRLALPEQPLMWKL
jgi:hypothetical protein